MQLATKENLQAEQAFKDLASAKYGLTLIDTDLYCPFDFIALKGSKVKSIIEYKKRNISFGDYKTFFESVHKIDSCLKVAEVLKVPFVYVIQYKDFLGAMKIDPAQLTDPVPGGRTDRGRQADIKPVYHFYITNLKQI